MLEQERAESILGRMKVLDVAERLKAINEAKALQNSIFSGSMNDAQWAYSAMTVQMLYNLVCDELRSAQKVIRHEIIETKVQPEKKKKEKTKPKELDMAAMIAALARFKEDNKK